MKAFFGFIQVGCAIGGVVALFNGEWLAMILCWLVALGVGLIGGRMVRHVEGISEQGQGSLRDIGRAVELLRDRRYASAMGTMRSAVISFRTGGDRALLCMASTLYAVTLVATRDLDGARRALDEAERTLHHIPVQLADDADELRSLQRLIRRRISEGNPDPDRFVDEILAYNDVL